MRHEFGDDRSLDELRVMIEHAAHLLPAQGPITAFVHHNTLHAFEDVPFEQAVVRGGRIFGCHPFLSEQRYREEYAQGRIRRADLETELIDVLGDRGDELLGFLGTRFHLRMAMLEHSCRTGPLAELRWVIAETDALQRFHEEAPAPVRDLVVQQTRRWVMRDLRNGAGALTQNLRVKEIVESVFEYYDKARVEQWDDATWESFCLQMLWMICRDGARHAPPPVVVPPAGVRHRDYLLEATGEDSDLLVNELLIRFCAAFLDQGFSNWRLPRRDDGFLASFCELYVQRAGPPDGWLRTLRSELLQIQREGQTPLELITASLDDLGVTAAEREEFITQSLLALRGYAGMIWQVETRGDRVANPIPEGSLIEFLAVRLLLERLALRYIAQAALGYQGPLAGLRAAARERTHRHLRPSTDQRAFLVFQLAQLQGWTPESLYRLSAQDWETLFTEIEAFSGLERRRIFHAAYERLYRHQALDAVATHGARRRRELLRAEFAESQDRSPRPAFQVVCCIDDREESFRRHLEEVAPRCETFGTAGFFAVAMYYRGAADAHHTPLCPVIIKPQHYVDEHVVYTFEKIAHRRRSHRRTIGTVTHRVHVGSRTFAGGWLAAVLGSLASLPLVMRIMFPRTTARLVGLVGGFVRSPAVTQLQLERTEPEPGPQHGHVGYTIDEMAGIVRRVLTDMGLVRRFARLVIICGHGSSSLNNPHESAHDCGACAGGRGGPNARVFAQMANNPLVRDRLARQGLAVPRDTHFIGAYHNTCDDSMTYYDLERLPASHKDDFVEAADALDDARQRNAHERCRCFESAPLNLTAEAALRHVEGRAADLSQVRPEFGHATNALCLVGSRDWSRNLFLDRRAFLQSYDPEDDDDEYSILTRILQAVIPVCAGINLEYYFSYVDPQGYGCGTKLPHNIASLLGVMNGAASDLRPGLPWQMVETHEPVRLLFVIETTPEAIFRIMEQNEGIDRLVRGRWVHLAVFDAETCELQVFREGMFKPHTPQLHGLPEIASSLAWYRGWRGHLGFASIKERAANA